MLSKIEGTWRRRRRAGGGLRTRSIAAALALTAAAAVVPAGASDDDGGTLLRSQISGVIEIEHGLCVPGDAPQCVGPWQTRYRVTSEGVSNGTFEGRSIVEGSGSSEQSGVQWGTVEGLTKPTCLTSRASVSGTIELDGVARDIQTSYAARGATVIYATGWVDDGDEDTDPVGDHSIVIELVTRADSRGGFPCVTEGVTKTTFTGVSVIG